MLRTLLLIAQLDILGDLGGWFEEVWDQIRSVDVKYLILGCTLETIQTVLNGLAWRNILAESYGRERTPARQLVAAYSGGIALNSFLPAQAGTFAYFGMFRVIIVGSAFAGILAAGVVQNLFYGVIGTLNYVFLFLSRPDSESTAEHQVTEDGGIKLVFLVLAAMLLLVVARFLWKRYHKVWDDAKAGAVILRRPRLYVTRVLSLQVASYVARIGVNATFMSAFGIPVTIRNIFLIIAANSVSSPSRSRPAASAPSRRWRRWPCATSRRPAPSPPTRWHNS